MTLTPAGVLAGTPTTAATSTVRIRGTDANGCFADVLYSITVVPASCPTITLSPSTMPAATVGVPYSQAITASGGTGTYTFTVTTGALPAGLTLTTAGVVAGTPTTAATSTFTIRGTDVTGCFAEVSYSVTVASAVLRSPNGR
jgi:hypothetical protein